MPENETLLYDDARSASRWRPLGERMDGLRPNCSRL